MSGLTIESVPHAALGWTEKLLEDLRAGGVDVVVVHKTDRLTRSLSDFAKQVELFDEHGVPFVSVSQAFNTTTSMGRPGRNPSSLWFGPLNRRVEIAVQK